MAGQGPVWRYAVDTREDLLESVRFMAVHAGLVVDDRTSARWLVIGAVMAAQAAAIRALSEAPMEDGSRRNPLFLIKQCCDEKRLRPPFTLTLSNADLARLKGLIEARNAFIHPPNAGWTLDLAPLPRGVSAVTKVVRHLATVQPTASARLGEGERESLDGALDHIDTAMDFWLSQFEGPAL